MKKVSDKFIKNQFYKIILTLILFLFFYFGISENIKNRIIFDDNNVYSFKEDIYVKKEDKIEDIVGTNNELSNFYLGLRFDNYNKDVTHPKIISFPKKWNGYKYWISYTPYPNGDQAKENPFVLASNDMIIWEAPKGLKNPLDVPKTNDSLHVYNSDTHLVYNSDTDKLECYWRFVNDINGKVILYKRTTRDGVHWTKKEIVLESIRKKADFLSPSIIYENKTYKMWYVDVDKIIKYKEYNVVNKEWTKPKIINITYKDPKLKSWHLDVIKTEKGYEAIIVAFDDWQYRGKMKLYYSFSEDNINWKKARTILESPDNGGIYRSSILYINNTYYVFYSEITKKYKRGVGILYGSDINKLSGLKKTKVGKFVQYVKKNG